MSLKDTLTAAKYRAIAESGGEGRDAIVSDWIGASERLYFQIQEWLSEYVSSKLLSIEIVRVNVKEDPFGVYFMPAMRIMAGNQTVNLNPVGRFITGATGRIDMFAAGRGGADERYRLLRKGGVDGEEENWAFMRPRDHKGASSSIDSYYILSKEDFESALDQLFR